MNTFKRFKYLILVLILGAGAAAVWSIWFTPEARKARLQEQAQDYFEAGEYEKAKIVSMNILRRDPANKEAIRHLGLIWLEQGVPLRALPFLLEMRKLAPNDLEMRSRLAVSLLALGDSAGAHREAQAVLQAAPDHGEALILLADTSLTPEEREATRSRLQAFPAQESADFHLATASLLVKERDLAGGEQAVVKALAVNPQSASAYLTAAAFRLAAKDMNEAERNIQKGSALAPLRSPQRLKYAEFKLQQGDHAAARKQASEIISQAPDYLPARILLAQIEFAAKDYDAAIKTLKEVFRVDGANYAAGMLQARLWIQKAEPARAVDVLERMQKIHPRHPAIRLELARAHVQNGASTQAMELLTQLSADFPDLPEAVLLRAEVNLRSGRPGASIPDLAALLEKRPQLLQAAVLLCSSYQGMGRTDDAIAVARQLVAGAPSNPRFHSLLGQTLRQGRHFDEAVSAFEKTLELDPGDVSAVGQLVDLDRTQQPGGERAVQRIDAFLHSKPDSAEAHFIKGRILYDQKNPDTAEIELARAIELDADFAPAYELLIQIYVTGRKIPEALERLEDLLSKRPKDERALMILALLREQQKDYVKSRETYEKLLVIRPDMLVALNNLAVLCSVHLNDLDKALEAARRARALQPAVDDSASPAAAIASASVADTLGWILYLRGQYADALPLIREAAARLGTNPEVQYHLGMTAYMMGQIETAKTALQAAVSNPNDFPGKPEAQARLSVLTDTGKPNEAVGQIKDLETLAQTNPQDSILQIRLGEAYETQKDWTRAASAYEQALKQNPALATAMGKLARLHTGPLPDITKAMELGRRARELEPDNPEIAGILGAAAFQSGDYSRAYDLLRESTRRIKNDAAVFHSLGWAAYSLGKVPEAREAMQNMLTAAPDSPRADDAKSFLSLTAPEDDAAAAALSAQAEPLLKNDPGYVPALMIRAAVQTRDGNSADAITGYTAVLKRFPAFAPAQKRLAALYAKDPAQYDKGFELAQGARKALPDDSELAQILGELSFHRKDYTYAVQLLKESSRRKALDSNGLYYMGMAQFNMGNRVESLDALTRAVAGGLSQPLQEEAKRVLEELEKPKAAGS